MAINYDQLSKGTLQDFQSNPDYQKAFTGLYGGDSANAQQLAGLYSSGARSFEADKGSVMKGLQSSLYPIQQATNAYGNFNDGGTNAAAATGQRDSALKAISDATNQYSKYGFDFGSHPDLQNLTARLGGTGTSAVGGDTASMDVANSMAKIPPADLAAFQKANPGASFTNEDLAQYNAAGNDASSQIPSADLASFQKANPGLNFTAEDLQHYNAAGNTTPFTGNNPQTIATAQASGQPPQDAGSARAAVQSLSAPQQQAATAQSQAQAKTSAINTALSNDPGYQQLLSDATAARSATTQSQSLLSQYQQMENAAGIPAIDTQLLNTQKIINGTEDDIRNEVQAANGFATDSQVLALSSSRNKVLIQNYNNLLQTKQMAESHISTMIGLVGQDKQNAIQVANQQLQIDSQIADYQQKFMTNAQQGYNNVIQAVGYKGLLTALNNDPNAISLAEKTLGLNPGSLQAIAAIPDPDAQLKAVQLDQAKANLAMAPLEAKAKQAAINASNASAASSSASAAKTKADLAFQQAHGGMTQTEVQAQNDANQARGQGLLGDASSQVESLANHKTTWGAAFNALSTKYPEADTNTIDSLLQANLYRNSQFGG